MATRLLLAPLVVVVALASSASTACTLSAGPPVVQGGVYVESAPLNVEAYPRLYYENEWVYLVGDRWYHRGPSGWVVIGTEPPGLRQHRMYWHQHRRFEPLPPPPRHEVPRYDRDHRDRDYDDHHGHPRH